MPSDSKQVFTDHQKLALAFSYMSYLGFEEIGETNENAANILAEIKSAIRDWEITNDQWQVVWGPAIFPLPGTKFDDAFMFLVQNTEDKNQFYLAIRGTNPISLPNWIIWDFQAKELKPWPFAEHKQISEGDDTKWSGPFISESTYFGLNTLLSIRPLLSIPGEKLTLIEFMDQELAKNPNARICVTGHSLGGVLASTLALWLTEIQHKHKFDKFEFSTINFAGPTAGNEAFAKHSNEKLAGKSTRIANNLDPVTYGWNTESMKAMPTMYMCGSLPWTMPTPPVYAFIKYLACKSKGKGYTHVGEAIEMEGKKYLPGLDPKPRYPLALTFLGQAIYQHLFSYPQLMGVSEKEIPAKKLFSASVVCELIDDLVKRK